MIFPKPGTATVQAQAKDSLGSVSAAYGEVSLFSPPASPSNAERLNMLAKVQDTGNEAATMAAITAVADQDAQAGVPADPTFSNRLLVAAQSTASSSLAKPTPEAVDSMAGVVTSVVAGASGT